MTTTHSDHASLRRSLNLPMAVLFGLGVTIGAGIYVLIGATAGRAGVHAPLAFLLAALVMAPTAASFAELAARLPVSAGEAEYVRAGFGAPWLARVVGIMVCLVGVVSAAAIAKGSAGYIRELVALPLLGITAAVIVVMGAVAAWGILQSVAIAGVMTMIEIGGLVAIISAGAMSSPDLIARLPEIWTGLGSASAMAGILSTSLLAFFAFIGFESLANIAEEVKDPRRTLPRAILLTLAISTVFYMLVVWVALVAVPHTDLAKAQAPLSLVFERVTGASPVVISAIAIVATINGIIAQLVMASRVMYGMADRGLLPTPLAVVHPRTQTPINATVLAVALTLTLALAFPLEGLAEATSRLTLVIFALVNASLVLLKRQSLKRQSGASSDHGYTVPMAVPCIGFVLCAGLLVGALFI